MPKTYHTAPLSYQVLIKPVGSACNLRCDYCYYLDKKMIYGEGQMRMSEEVLEKFTKEYIQSQQAQAITFVWHGGEPTLAGLDFFKHAVRFQKQYAGEKTINNVFQTNALLLDEEWCEFFKKENFLLGVSIDGPKEVHDFYRKGKIGKGSYDELILKLRLLYQHKIEYNIMAVVNNINVHQPKEFYDFLSNLGSSFIQFTPLVERVYKDNGSASSFLVSPDFEGECEIADFSVNPDVYGEFLCVIFDEWVKKDVGRIFVQLFDNTLASHMKISPDLCIFNKYCGNTAVMEYNGDLYSCDHYVYKDNLLGNISSDSLIELILSERQSAFSREKEEGLSSTCRKCLYLKYCRGECPKNRFAITPQNERINYICGAYKLFFAHVQSSMDFMANELKNKRPPANIMQWIKEKKSNN